MAVSIENSINQKVDLSLRIGTGEIRRVTLFAGDTVPNTRFPATISGSEVSTYTKGLAKKGYISIEYLASEIEGSVEPNVELTGLLTVA